jgi:hypothetical protein
MEYKDLAPMQGAIRFTTDREMPELVGNRDEVVHDGDLFSPARIYVRTIGL